MRSRRRKQKFGRSRTWTTSNSLAVRIPKALADAIKASDGKRSRVD
jgi:antitoxin component of MazEF toxin-antitoxin module